MRNIEKNALQQSLLWQTLAALTRLERKHLEQWLRSPFFCRRQQPLALFGYLNACSESGTIPDPAGAWKALAGTSTAADKKVLRLVMSELLTQTEHFLVYREKFGVAEDFNIRLAAAYRKRGLKKHFSQSVREARAAWSRQPCRHTEYFDAQADIEYELYQHLSADRRTEALNLQELFDQTDHAFIARKLRQACMALSHQTVYKAEYRFGLLEAVLDYVHKNVPLQQMPAIGLYFYCCMFLTNPEGEGYFLRFKRQLLDQQAQLPEDEQRNLHLLAINFCIRKINQSQPTYSGEALDLYRSALKAGLLLENGLLSHFAYNNITAIAIKVGDADWAEGFIHEYAPFLEKKHSEPSFHLNLARVEYKRRNLKSALLHLQQADYKDLINNLIAKTLQLKIYYETSEFDALDAHLQSMQTFIHRQRVIGYHKTNYLNMIRFTRRLMQQHPDGRAARETLRQQIETEPVLTEKEWFLEQIG
ncbi:MAG: hypothetical protein KA165_13480 [Saprospiraceae bacterium]|nr:hypothetical protein [Saprospiraceae bacterium]